MGSLPSQTRRSALRGAWRGLSLRAPAVPTSGQWGSAVRVGSRDGPLSGQSSCLACRCGRHPTPRSSSRVAGRRQSPRPPPTLDSGAQRSPQASSARPGPVWGELGPTLHCLPSQAVPALPLAGARVQPDKDGLLFCVEKSIIPAMFLAIGREVHRHQLAGGAGRGLQSLGAGSPVPGGPRPGPSRGPRPQPCCEGGLSSLGGSAFPIFQGGHGAGTEGPGPCSCPLWPRPCAQGTQCPKVVSALWTVQWGTVGDFLGTGLQWTLAGTHWSRPSPAESLPAIAQPPLLPAPGNMDAGIGERRWRHAQWAGTWSESPAGAAGEAGPLGPRAGAARHCCGFRRKQAEKVLELGAAW